MMCDSLFIVRLFESLGLHLTVSVAKVPGCCGVVQQQDVQE